MSFIIKQFNNFNSCSFVHLIIIWTCYYIAIQYLYIHMNLSKFYPNIDLRNSVLSSASIFSAFLFLISLSVSLCLISGNSKVVSCPCFCFLSNFLLLSTLCEKKLTSLLACAISVKSLCLCTARSYAKRSLKWIHLNLKV